MKKPWARVALSVLSLALAVTLVLFLPQIVGTLTGKTVSWAEIGHEFAGLGPATIGLMAATWLASLLAYTFVLTNSLPGLTHTQALTLNAAGSAVSNVLPFGGAAGVALTFAMTRGWGFANRPIVVMTLVSGIWNTLFRFILPAVGIIALLMAGKVPDQRVANAGWVGALSILAIVAVLAVALYWDRAARVVGRFLDKVTPKRLHAGEAFHNLRRDTAGIVKTRSLGLSIGMVAFLGLQWVIMVECMHATGSYPGLAQSIAVFALSRVLTSAVITPSGAGIMEAGTAAFLVSFGVADASAAATALLFGFWTYTIEIPFGGLALGAWAFLRRRDGRGSRTEASEAVKAES
ncbi:lysylphosphatidylglycerol synthase domain-containing protein [Nonomuraea sp. NPDC050310]|uniref:lysylphosphatidylglycerol synthase domain-containing protein n=1 Tax=unclassified Nonomuraea TaxID=2593643 RepID=UPI0033DAFAEF